MLVKVNLYAATLHTPTLYHYTPPIASNYRVRRSQHKVCYIAAVHTLARAWPTLLHTVPPHIVRLIVEVMMKYKLFVNRQVILGICYLFY